MATTTKIPDINDLPDCAIVRLYVILAWFAVSKSTWWAWSAAGRVPKSVRIGDRAVGWRVGELRPLLAGTPNPPMDHAVAAAVAKRVANRKAQKAAEAERLAAKRALLGEV